MSIVIGGGSGFIGTTLAKLATSKGFNVINVSRNVKPNSITWNDVHHTGLPTDCRAIVSMSGEPILQPFKRWTDDMKMKIKESRVDKTKLLNQAICAAAVPPKVFVSLSGIGYYKPDFSREYTELDKVVPFDYLSELTKDWEAAATLPTTVKTRSVIIRTGIVLGNGGGIIKNIRLPFSYGMGGPVGSGKQWFSWIHVQDMAGLIMYAIENDSVSGVINGTAPNPVTYGEFSKAYASALSRPHLIPMPAFVVNAMFGSEAGAVMLEGQKVLPKRTTELGYKFRYSDIKSACKELAS